MLKQKVADLEAETERITEENRRLAMRASRRPTPSPADQLQHENNELKSKLEELEKKLADVSTSRKGSLGKPPSGSDKEQLDGE